MSDLTEQPRVEETAEVVMQMLENDRPRDELFERIDAAVGTVFEPDAAIKALPYVKNRHYAMTDIADARNTGVRTFDSLLPNIEIQPLNDDQQEYERTDMAEQALQWEFERMNRIGQKSIHTQILEDAMSYHAVAFQTEYLPFKFKGIQKDGRMRAMLRQRSFNWLRHHPKTVHARYSDYGLEAVAKVSNYSMQSLIDRFGRDNEGIQRMLTENAEMTPVAKLRMFYTLVDYTDWENRIVWAVPAGMYEPGSLTRVPLASTLYVTQSQYVFMNKKHEMPFMNWVIVDKGNPIWEAVLKSGTWDNLQYMNLIRFAKAIELSTRSTLVIKTPDGSLRNVWVDFSNPSNPIILPLDGSVVDNLAPAPIDPGLETMFQDASAKVASSTVSHVLRDVTKFSNAPFSTVNQMVQMALGQLSRAKNTAGDSEAFGFIQMFEWIDFSQLPFSTYRPEGRDSKAEDKFRGKGEQITIMPGQAPKKEDVDAMGDQQYAAMKRTVYYDLDALYLKVELQANDATDEQARINTNINAVEKLGMSKQMAWERMGWKNYKLAQNQRMEEVFLESALQNEVMKDNQQVLEEMKAKAMQEVQQQMTQAKQNSAMNGGSQPTAEGADLRAGGNSFARQAPGMGREQLTGQTAEGGQVVQ